MFVIFKVSSSTTALLYTLDMISYLMLIPVAIEDNSSSYIDVEPILMNASSSNTILLSVKSILSILLSCKSPSPLFS